MEPDPAAEALQDYFNCYYRPTSPTLRKFATERLFNVLTPETVNKLYTIQTIIGERTYSPLQVISQTENLSFVKRLIVEKEADLFLSEGEHGIHPLRSLLTTYAHITYSGLLYPDHVYHVRHDEVVMAIVAGLTRLTDKTGVSDAFEQAIRQSGITPVDCVGLLSAVRKELQEAAWNRRRHLIPVYIMRLGG